MTSLIWIVLNALRLDVGLNECRLKNDLIPTLEIKLNRPQIMMQVFTSKRPEPEPEPTVSLLL